MPQISRSGRRSFTLLEMLVALSLMSVMAASLYASLHIGFRARRSARAVVEPVRRAQSVLEMLHADLEAALPPVGILAAEFVGVNAVDEDGRDADTLLLHTTAYARPGAIPTCGIRRVELALTSPSDGTNPALVRLVTTQLLAPETPEPVEEVLSRGVSGFNLRYFDGVDWLDAWDSTVQGNLLPLAVEVTIRLERRDDRQGEAAPYRLSLVCTLPCSRPPSEGGSRP